MCGFCGIYDPKGVGLVDPDLLQGMTRLMAERGPDAEGTYVSSHVGLGHRRLSIIDLDAGEQPVFNEDRSVAVVFNGEIFNFRELRRQLQAQGHRFATHTDTEVIVHAYEEYGDRCVEHFRGMFAFAIYDHARRRIFLARDRLGVKPLYYAVHGGTLLFASEVKPLLLALGGTARVEPAAVDHFVTTGYGPRHATMFAGIHKLPPGHTLQWGAHGPHLERYWDLPDTGSVEIGEPEALERLHALLKESIALRMVSDVPVGAFLSGGVDSSLVVGQMCELSSSPVRTYSIGYDDSCEHSELPHARAVAQRLGTQHTEHILTSHSFFEGIEAFVLRTEEPIVEAAGIALYQLARRARQDVSVVLSGEGGDEILSGYPIYRTMSALHRSQGLRDLSGLGAAARALAARVCGEKAVKYLDWLGGRLPDTYMSVPTDVTEHIHARLYTKAFAAQVGSKVRDDFRLLYGHLRGGTALQRMAYTDFKTWLPDDLLLKADKMSMAASIELRVPLLDHKLVEFCMTLPDRYRLRGTVGKYLLKRAAERWIPPSIVHRKKQGFPTPLAQWFRTDLYDRVHTLLLSPRARHRGYFDPRYVEQVLARHRSGAEDLSRRLLSMVILETWHKTFADGVCQPVADAQRRLASRQLRRAA